MLTICAVTFTTGRRALLVAIGLVALALLPAAAAAQDIAIDGVWHTDEADFGFGPIECYLSLHQSGIAVVGGALDVGGGWNYFVGTRAGSEVTGTVFFFDGIPAGTFRLRVTGPGTLTGETVIDDETTPLTATRLF